MKAQQVDLLLMGFGPDYALGTVSFKDGGLTTDKDAYVDKDKSLAVANPYTLNALGRTANPVYGDGWYKLTIAKADGTGILTFDNLYFGVLEQSDTRSGSVKGKSGSYQILKTDDYIVADCSSTNIILTLPDLTTFTENIRISCVKGDQTSNTLTIDGYGAQTINGSLTVVIKNWAMGLIVYPTAAHTGWVAEEGSYATINDSNDMIKDTLLRSVVPAGSIFAYGGTTAPTGFLMCNGASYLRADYPDLFVALDSGATWGYADGTHFYVPDFRGRAVLCAGSGAGLTPRALAAVGGEETHAMADAENGLHSHGIHDSDAADLYMTGSTSSHCIIQGTIAGSNSNAAYLYTATSGSSTPHNNMMPWVASNFIIKT